MPNAKSLKRGHHTKLNKSLKKLNKRGKSSYKKGKNNDKMPNKKKKNKDCKLAFESFEGSMHNPKYDMPIEDDLIEMLNTPFAPKTVKPTNDYYTYINDEWIQKTAKELDPQQGKFYVQVDDFRIAQEKVYY